jgi:hypothetical protein
MFIADLLKEVGEWKDVTNFNMEAGSTTTV